MLHIYIFGPAHLCTSLVVSLNDFLLFGELEAQKAHAMFQLWSMILKTQPCGIAYESIVFLVLRWEEAEKARERYRLVATGGIGNSFETQKPSRFCLLGTVATCI